MDLAWTAFGLWLMAFGGAALVGLSAVEVLARVGRLVRRASRTERRAARP